MSNQSGITFTHCAVTAAAAEHGHGHSHPRRREVVVAGKRVKTVDIHAHCCVPEAMAVIKHPLEAPGLLMEDTSTRLAAMDAQGIDVECLSINPFWYRAGKDEAAELIRIQNETLVEFCAANPERFVGFATAALQHPELAAEQVEHAVKKLGFRGVGVGGSVAGEELANPRFHPFWKKCEELGVLVFMHPLGTREVEHSGKATGNQVRDGMKVGIVLVALSLGACASPGVEQASQSTAACAYGAPRDCFDGRDRTDRTNRDSLANRTRYLGDSTLDITD